MGSYYSIFNKSNHSDLQVYYLNTNQKLYLSQNTTLKSLFTQLNQNDSSSKSLFFNWTLVDTANQNLTLKQIVLQNSIKYPLTHQNKQFILIDNSSNLLNNQSNKNTQNSKILYKLKKVWQIKSTKTSNYQTSKNNHIVFEGRETALFASALTYALRKIGSNQQKLNSLLKNLKSGNKLQKNKNQDSDFSLIGKLCLYLGILKNQDSDLVTSKNLFQTIQNLKSSTDFSDFDPKFVYYIAQVYLKFMIQSKFHVFYIDYKTLDDFSIQNISSKSKIGIIGDFGTGLNDSIQLLRNMIIKHKVTTIIHLGDVYYAGTPDEYQRGIIEPLKKLRLQVKRQIRFYSIPGNHDYYSWGLPFLSFVKNINQTQFHKQNASYFCLRDESNKWQFLGMDSSYFDSNPLNQIYPYGVGPFVQEKQLQWHKYRLRNFNGSTILLTHHQLFSIHQRINGKLTDYRKFSCINPILYSQLFENISQISAWFWGHEHSLMMFKQNLFGLPKGRLLGNSSFHVFYGKEHPYKRAQGFPKIPYIVQDQEYYKKYLPLNPNLREQNFFGLSYGIIDLSKMDKQNNIPIEYWCSPSYSNGNEIIQKQNLRKESDKRLHFQQFKIYEQTIYSIDHIRKNRLQIKNHDILYLRSQIGLNIAIQYNLKQQINNNNLVEQNQIVQQEQQNLSKQGKHCISKSIRLNLLGSPFQIQFIKSEHDSINQNSQFALKYHILSEQKQANLYLGLKKDTVQLIQIKQKNQLELNNCIWYYNSKINNQKTKTEKYSQLFYRQPVKIYNKSVNKSLAWQIVKDQVYPILQETKASKQTIQKQENQKNIQNTQSLWMFQNEQLIKQ